MNPRNNSQKALFFDAGPIITLIMARLWWILPSLKKQFGGHFYITPAVKKEVVERPLEIQRFEFEALQVAKMIQEGIFEVYTTIPDREITPLINLANGAFSIAGKNMDIIQSGEMESVASAVKLGAPVVMDERTLRLLIENSGELQKLLELRFQKKVWVQPQKIKDFKERLGKVSIIRSIELVGIAYQMGLLDDYTPKMARGKEILLDSVLWNAKYNGCAVTGKEIEEIKKYLLR